MEHLRPLSATAHMFKRGAVPAACLTPAADCALARLADTAPGVVSLVPGQTEQGRSLRPDAAPAHNGPPAADPGARQGAEVARPIIFLTCYCTLLRSALTIAIKDALTILSSRLRGSDGPISEEAIVFYYGWHGEAALIDIAIPAKDALERPRDCEVRASVMPASVRSTVPTGGIAGLRAARERLRLAAGAPAADQLFRVWQAVPLQRGKLPKAWLRTPLHCAQ